MERLDKHHVGLVYFTRSVSLFRNVAKALVICTKSILGTALASCSPTIRCVISFNCSVSSSIMSQVCIDYIYTFPIPAHYWHQKYSLDILTRPMRKSNSRRRPQSKYPSSLEQARLLKIEFVLRHSLLYIPFMSLLSRSRWPPCHHARKYIPTQTTRKIMEPAWYSRRCASSICRRCSIHSRNFTRINPWDW